MKGTVKFFNRTKGFGFIAADEGTEEYFVHETAITDGSKLDEGDKVEFEATQSDRGPRAQDVKKVDGASAASAEDDEEPEGLAALDE